MVQEAPGNLHPVSECMVGVLATLTTQPPVHACWKAAETGSCVKVPDVNVGDPESSMLLASA